MDKLFKDMLNKGDWLDIAIAQKAKNLTVALAHSQPVYLDGITISLILQTKINWN